jgi:hypothetical protein
MICLGCLEIRRDCDFLMGNVLCYRCIFREKTKNMIPVRKKEKCKICGIALSRGRWSYCSEECTEIGRIKFMHDVKLPG